MDRLISFFIAMFFVSNLAVAQIFIHQPGVYYEYPYQEDEDGCHYYSMETDSSLLTFNQEFGDYIDLKIFDVRKNMKYFNEDADGFYHCSYDSDDKKVGNRRYYSSVKKKLPELEEYIDTIYLLRNKPSIDYNPNSRRGDSNSKEFPYESIELLTSSQDHLQESLVDVQVEFRTGDIISKKGKFEILCPYNITAEVIIELNSKLIKVGYLVDKKRGKYHGKIRDALYEFQEDNDIEVGFINQETIKLLKLNIIID